MKILAAQRLSALFEALGQGDLFVSQPGFVDTEMAKADVKFWVATPAKAARQIYGAIRARRRHVCVTRRWRLVAWVMKLLPARLLARL